MNFLLKSLCLRRVRGVLLCRGWEEEDQISKKKNLWSEVTHRPVGKDIHVQINPRISLLLCELPAQIVCLRLVRGVLLCRGWEEDQISKKNLWSEVTHEMVLDDTYAEVYALICHLYCILPLLIMYFLPYVIYIYMTQHAGLRLHFKKKKISEVKPQSGYKWSVFALDLQEWKWIVCNACMHSNIQWPRGRHTELPCCVGKLHAWGFDQHW